MALDACNLPQALRDRDSLLSLSPEDLAEILLPILVNTRWANDNLSLNTFLPELDLALNRSGNRDRDVERAIAEAWGWMISTGLLALSPGGDPQQDFVFATRRGREAAQRDGFAKFRKTILLPPSLLHIKVRGSAWPIYMRGNYDIAVFAACREVEVAVRDACGYGSDKYGVPLMRDAFRENGGPLADKSVPVAEQEALAHLFAGAYGYYRNPTAHRNVTITDPAEAAEMLMLASHLLRIVDDRAAQRRRS